MTKQELIDAVAKKVEKLDVSKTAVKEIVDATFEEVAKAIKKEKRFQVPAFGTFSVKARKARTGRNPKTGETLKIKASKTVGFKPAPTLKDSL
jgi:DNA-binding protein HU-beta